MRVTNRRSLLAGISALALTAASSPALAWRERDPFNRFGGGGSGGSGGGGGGGGGRPRQNMRECPRGGLHAWARVDDGRNPRIAYMRCLKCGLIRPQF